MATKYFDQLNGNDTTGDGTLGNPWKTIEKAMAVLTAGDVGVVRNNGSSEAWAVGKSPTNAGTMASPIVLKADDGTAWAADLTSLTNTYTCTNGSTSVTASATESQLATGKQVKFGTEDRWYTVESVVTTTVTLEMKYRGVGGSGLAGTMLPAMPKLTIADGSGWNHNKDFWRIERVHFDTGGAYSFGIFYDVSSYTVLDGCRLTPTAGEVCLNPSDFGQYLRCQLTGGGADFGLVSFYRSQPSDPTYFEDSQFEGGSNAVFYGLGYPILVVLAQVESTGTGDLLSMGAAGRGQALGYGVQFASTNFITNYLGDAAKSQRVACIQDYDGTERDNRIFTTLDPADSDAALRRNTATVRTGGADSSIEVRPSTYVGTDAEWRRLLAHEAYLYLPASAQTVTVYFNLPAANFTAAPTAAQLWIELHYLKAASGSSRQLLKSTGTVLADGNWNSLAVTFTPGIAGEAFLRVWYAKTKEASKTNYLYVDPEPVIS